MTTVRKRIFLRMVNAIIVSAITFFSTLSISYPPTLQNIWASFIAFMLTLLVQLKAIVDDLSANGRHGRSKEATSGGEAKTILLSLI